MIAEALIHLGKNKQLQKINKEAYYYTETLKNYKKLFKDKNKQEEVAQKILSKIPGFKKFMNENSLWATMFGMPGNNNIAQNLPGTGGGCDFHTYTWERSINNGAWHPIGNGAAYPNVGLVGNSRFRRKLTCGNEEMYTNIVSFQMSTYNSPNIENLNYVRVNTISVPYVASWEEADNLVTGKKIQQTTYFDGLQRPIQKVIKQGGLIQSTPEADPTNVNNYQDLVEIYDYDALGRNTKNYLPFASMSTPGFFKTNALAEQKQFNNSKYGEPVNSNFTFSTITYDNSPLNEIVNSKLPGSIINSNSAYKGISNDYSLYKTTDVVKMWDIDYSANAVPINTGLYLDGKLFKTFIKDEKDKLVVNYTDMAGNLILKKVQEKEVGPDLDQNGHLGWNCTYYVYDDFNRLRYTITPKAVADMNTAGGGLPLATWVVTSAIKEGLCFYVEYDKKGRVIKKHSPDAGEIWLVYDNRNRLVFSQDEKQRNRPNESPAKPKQWSFMLYDELDRLVATGLTDDSRDRIAMQTMVSAVINPINKQVELYTGSWETITAYNPFAGNVPGGGSHCGSCTSTITNIVNYYDKYNANAFTFQTITNADFAPGSETSLGYPALQPIKSGRIKEVLTNIKVRVIDDKYDNGILTDDQFLSSTYYYDEKANLLQSLASNIKAGIEVTSYRYDFAGKVMSIKSKHGATNSIYNGLISVAKPEYDLLGREIGFNRLYSMNAADISDNNKYKKLVEVSMDEFGRVKTKKIGTDPENSSLAMETQDISYNIQGQLTGINKDYAQSISGYGNGAQWHKRFGMSMGYEDGTVFGSNFTPQFNGNISGIIWRSQGDNTQRKYNFEYDNLGRFKNASFTQKESISNSSPWLASKVNLSSLVSSYDGNGNILGLQHIGIIPGSNGGILIDNLQYQYFPNSNQLKSVTDLAFAGDPTKNGKQGDFKDYSAANAIDYQYDKNGNLEIDKNKAIIDDASELNSPLRGVFYNFLDLPQQISIKDKSKTDYIYDATGNKLGKKLTLLTAGAPPAKTTWFIDGLVYEDDELQYILHEEGRLRIMEPVAAYSLPSNSVNYLDIRGKLELINNGNTHKWGVWDYFIKDHLSNTRLVLTDEYHRQMLKCSMEDANTLVRDEEVLTFGKTGGGNEVSLTRFGKYASGWPTDPADASKVSKLLNQPGSGGFSQAIGPNVLLKVMAGDEVAGTVEYYYNNLSVTSNNGNLLNTIVAGFINGITGGAMVNGIIKDNSTAISVANTGSGSPINEYLNNQPIPNQNSTPKAYLNIIFFDEQFRYVGESSEAIMVEETAVGTKKTGSRTLSKMALKNGYVYVYVSNESTNIPVFFDNLIVSHNRGAIVEDNAYYPFGLKIQGISAKAALKPQNGYNYQGAFSEEDSETGYNEFDLRSYDPQLGRWIQIDPINFEAGMYNGMGNNPIIMLDPKGASPLDWIKTAGSNTWQWVNKSFNSLGEAKIFDDKITDWKNVDFMEGEFNYFADGNKLNILKTIKLPGVTIIRKLSFQPHNSVNWANISLNNAGEFLFQTMRRIDYEIDGDIRKGFGLDVKYSDKINASANLYLFKGHVDFSHMEMKNNLLGADISLKAKGYGEVGGSLDLLGLETTASNPLEIHFGTYSYKLKDKIGLGPEKTTSIFKYNVFKGAFDRFSSGGLKFAQEIKLENKTTSHLGFKALGVSFKITYDPSIK